MATLDAAVTPHRPSLLLVAHGTRDPAGAAVIEGIAARVSWALPGVSVAAAYVDVTQPTPAQVLVGLPGPVVVVPLFLAAGYHVRTDLPAQLCRTGRADLVLGETLGPDPALIAAAAQRLEAAGVRESDAVVLAVAGSSDSCAQADGVRAARRLGRRLGRPVTLATIASGGPRIADVVNGLHEAGASRVAAASWLLAPGLFQRRLAASGAEVIAAPLADHFAVLDVVGNRYRAALVQAAYSA